MYLSFSEDYSVAAEDPWPAGGAEDLIYNGNIDISGPSNPKVDTRNDITVTSSEFWFAGGRRATLRRRVDRRTLNLTALSKLAAQITPKSIPITIYLLFP